MGARLVWDSGASPKKNLKFWPSLSQTWPQNPSKSAKLILQHRVHHASLQGGQGRPEQGCDRYGGRPATPESISPRLVQKCYDANKKCDCTTFETQVGRPARPRREMTSSLP